jgi:hypothetical protein
MYINCLEKEANMCAKNTKFGALHFHRRVRFLVLIRVSQQIMHFPFILLADCRSRDGSLAGTRQDMTLYVQSAEILPVEFQPCE